MIVRRSTGNADMPDQRTQPAAYAAEKRRRKQAGTWVPQRRFRQTYRDGVVNHPQAPSGPGLSALVTEIRRLAAEHPARQDVIGSRLARSNLLGLARRNVGMQPFADNLPLPLALRRAAVLPRRGRLAAEDYALLGWLCCASDDASQGFRWADVVRYADDVL